MTGQNFCEKVNEYSKLIGEQQKGIGVIQCNPDQSKHLETARMLILDIWIDFVNLRSETYTENSRIPTMRLSPRSVTACRAVCLRWSELLSSLCLEFLADVDDGNADSSACFAGLGGALVPTSIFSHGS
uniref:Uncharacterized protein n=1 Tax=Zea mays TaxID=4577 RepID=A0A804PSX4_MAIZE